MKFEEYKCYAITVEWYDGIYLAKVEWELFSRDLAWSRNFRKLTAWQGNVIWADME